MIRSKHLHSPLLFSVIASIAISFSMHKPLAPPAHGAVQPKRVRFDVRSVDGKKMLAIYAKAVAKMQGMVQNDTRSWTFQWYTHWVKNGGANPSDTDSKWKIQALKAIYPNGMPKPAADLAMEIWNSCQAHGDGMDENMFLPWHRMFVCRFEEIIRSISGEDSFTMPYWNYSSDDMAIRGVIPEEFTKKGDAVFGSLYVEGRNAGVNTGTPIQNVPGGGPGDPLSTDILSACTYEDNFPVIGFCSGIDTVPHGSVHVQIGAHKNMGNVPWAANDPIFWLHHCNVDRLWASWNAAGRKNPALTGTFAFVDKDGRRTICMVPDYLDIATPGYSYDKLQAVPACAFAQEKPLKASKTRTVLSPKDKQVKLGRGPTNVTLEPVAPSKDEQGGPLRKIVANIGTEKHLYLVAKNLQTEVQPGVLYNLYLDLPANPTQKQLALHHVGMLNFFGAMAPGGGHGKAVKKERFLSFDVTKLAKSLNMQNLLKESTIVTIIPAGEPHADSRPVIGEFTLVER